MLFYFLKLFGNIATFNMAKAIFAVFFCYFYAEYLIL